MTTLTARRLDLEGVRNLRDLGGYPTHDGRRTRWRTVFRADSPHRLTPAARRALTELGVRTFIDLRRPSEVALAGYAFEADGLTTRAIPLFDDEPPAGRRALAEIYRAILAERGERLAAVFRVLRNSLPAVVHCTAGKDRTGVVVALLLALAGVPDEVIAEDYALTSISQTGEYWQEARQRAEQAGVPWEQYQSLLVCPPDLMLATLAFLREQYGDAGSYLRNAGLAPDEIDDLRRAMIE
jgi:protein-tyrosine phosphatase